MLKPITVIRAQSLDSVKNRARNALAECMAALAGFCRRQLVKSGLCTEATSRPISFNSFDRAARTEGVFLVRTFLKRVVKVMPWSSKFLQKFPVLSAQGNSACSYKMSLYLGELYIKEEQFFSGLPKREGTEDEVLIRDSSMSPVWEGSVLAAGTPAYKKISRYFRFLRYLCQKQGCPIEIGPADLRVGLAQSRPGHISVQVQTSFTIGGGGRTPLENQVSGGQHIGDHEKVFLFLPDVQQVLLTTARMRIFNASAFTFSHI